MTLKIKVLKKVLLDFIVKNKSKINKNLFLVVFNYISETSEIELELDYQFTKKKIESSVTSLKLSWKNTAKHTNRKKDFLASTKKNMLNIL